MNTTGSAGPFALDHLIEKLVGGVAKYYLYNPAGRAATVLDQNGPRNSRREFRPGPLRGEIFASGRHIATYANNTTYFDYSDWLGTERMRATISGYEQDACKSLPYGDGFICTGNTDPSPLHFTGRHHDAETALDHFPARNYTSSWGRWLTPDPGGAGASATSPQSWDMYAYAGDDPATLTDPSGANVRVCVQADAKDQTCMDMTDEQYYQLRKAQNGKDEIKMPGGTFPNGNITCGGKVCGSAHSYEPGMEDQSLNLFGIAGVGDLAVDGLRVGAAAAGDIGRAVAGFVEDLGTDAARTVPDTGAVDLENLTPKIQRQMTSRGWSKQEILDTVQQAREGGDVHTVTSKATGGAATEFVSPSTGRFVVIDKETGQVIQVSGPGFRPNYHSQ
ncbi:MAG: RHS repeat-associated core domain-containing protein [Terriglobales bacterium]